MRVVREARDVSRCIGQKLMFLMKHISDYSQRFLSQHDKVCEIVVFECLFWESLCDNLELIECQKALRVLGAFCFSPARFLAHVRFL